MFYKLNTPHYVKISANINSNSSIWDRGACCTQQQEQHIQDFKEWILLEHYGY